MNKNELPENIVLSLTKATTLRYGENPHQKGALFEIKNLACQGIAQYKQLNGKELSFNNLLDANSAYELVNEFKNPACVIVKHNTPCGVACNNILEKAFLNAYNCDSLSAFGGIIALNKKVDGKTAQAIINSGFVEVVLAPAFEKIAVKILSTKKNLRVLQIPKINIKKFPFDIKLISGGILLQDKDTKNITAKDLKVVTKKKPTNSEINSLLFAFKVVQFVKSNAIVLAQNENTIGIGGGQTSRVESVKIAHRKYLENKSQILNSKSQINDSIVLASDAFFPMLDGIEEAHKIGVKAIIQPGGSIKDNEVIECCNKYNIAMVFTGVRHFKH